MRIVVLRHGRQLIAVCIVQLAVFTSVSDAFDGAAWIGAPGNAAPEHKPNSGITEVEIPVTELPAGKKLTVAVRPVSSLGTKGKTIGTTLRV